MSRKKVEARSSPDNRRQVFGREVFGVRIDPETRCAHYHGANDIVAIRFKCCRKWFSCHVCHSALASDDPQVWAETEWDQRLVLCGACGFELTAREYFGCEWKCPRCHRSFNPGCAQHYHFYFATPGGALKKAVHREVEQE